MLPIEIEMSCGVVYDETRVSENKSLQEENIIEAIDTTDLSLKWRLVHSLHQLRVHGPDGRTAAGAVQGRIGISGGCVPREAHLF